MARFFYRQPHEGRSCRLHEEHSARARRHDGESASAKALLATSSDVYLLSQLIGIDNCDDGDMIGQAYNDPQGVTRRFILAGVDEAGLCLHGNLGPKKGLIADNFSYVSRYNKVLGRHEAYLRCETEDLRIPFPASETNEEGGVTLKKGE